MPPPCPTWIEINLSAIEDNTRLIAEKVKVPLLAVVKDDGYGHGALETGQAFLRAGGTWLAVVRCAEGYELRQNGILAPILVFGGAVPDEMEDAIGQDLTLPLYSFECAELIAARAVAAGKKALVHLKIDTGMGRYGVFPEETLALARRALELGWIKIDGLFSHFALAGDDAAFSALQIRRFKEALASLQQNNISPRWVHLANSSGIVHEPDSYFNLVRAGGILYGLGSDRDALSAPLRRPFSWKARLMDCKAYPADWGIGYMHDYKTRQGEVVGVVPVGHGDGYRRVPGTFVLIDGQRVPVVGRICMDQLMISLPKRYPIGQEVVLVGSQGSQSIHPEELRNTWKSTYSGVTLVHPRVPRVYLRD